MSHMGVSPSHASGTELPATHILQQGIGWAGFPSGGHMGEESSHGSGTELPGANETQQGSGWSRPSTLVSGHMGSSSEHGTGTELPRGPDRVHDMMQ